MLLERLKPTDCPLLQKLLRPRRRLATGLSTGRPRRSPRGQLDRRSEMHGATPA